MINERMVELANISEAKKTQSERIERLKETRTIEEGAGLIYMWVKQGVVSKKEFIELVKLNSKANF